MKSDALHMILNGRDQSGGQMMGAVVKTTQSVGKTLAQSSSKTKGVSLASKLHKG